MFLSYLPNFRGGSSFLRTYELHLRRRFRLGRLTELLTELHRQLSEDTAGLCTRSALLRFGCFPRLLPFLGASVNVPVWAAKENPFLIDSPHIWRETEAELCLRIGTGVFAGLQSM